MASGKMRWRSKHSAEIGAELLEFRQKHDAVLQRQRTGRGFVLRLKFFTRRDLSHDVNNASLDGVAPFALPEAIRLLHFAPGRMLGRSSSGASFLRPRFLTHPKFGCFRIQNPLWTALALLFFTTPALAQRAPKPNVVVVTIDIAKPANRFRPSEALGAGVDGHEAGDIAKIYTPGNLAAMRSAGFRPLSYRLRTELGIEAWHWNPAGRWSDAKNQNGYWISDDKINAPARVSNGYHLPRRGNTIDQANNRGYSRLDDGDSKTFWKSNPYLDSHYTGESDALHPQWVLLDFGAKVPLNALRIAWGKPFAVCYKVAYQTASGGENFSPYADGAWKAFPFGAKTNGKGGNALLRLSSKPIRTRYIRILLTESSKTAPSGSVDIRDGLGYAIREIYAGNLNAAGRFTDLVRHGREKDQQTICSASSTDPWHRAEDRDKNVEQPGFDTVLNSGLTNGLPMLTPVAVVYDTPDNAAAEIRYLKAKGIPLTQIEIGEEPDGQYLAPEDYGALYLQYADAIHAVAPKLKLGGPGFQTDVAGWHTWPDAQGNTSWVNRFLRYMKRRGRMQDFNFFSFEWYPFDDVCAPPAPQLAQHSAMFSEIMRSLDRDGLNRAIPRIITEYGYSAFAGRAEVDLPGAILNAEIAAQFVTMGGSAAYLYGYEPNSVIHEKEVCDAWGNLMLFQENDEGGRPIPLPCYYGAKLLTQEWAQSGNGLHEIFPAACEIAGKKNPILAAFATRRPDGQWAVLLLNKDPKHAYKISVNFRNATTGKTARFAQTFHIAQYSQKQYQWKDSGANGHPIRDFPPKISTIAASTRTSLLLPAYSITVIRGRMEE